MAYPASKKVSYLGQFGILAGFTGGGLIAGILATSIIVLASGRTSIDTIFSAENAGVLRIAQFISTFLIFFLPAILYARICHKRAFHHLGYSKPVNASQFIVVILIMIASLPLVGVLGEVVEKLPFSEATLKMFRKAEEEYMKQIEVIGRMKNTGDFILSLFMLAIFPALFEETLFRGGLQNLLSRWWKTPLLAVIVTSVLFSFIHLSYIGFLSRALLGFILGWMYHRTGNLWFSIIGHVTNNAIALTVLYVMKLKYPSMKLDEGPEFPVWAGAASLIALIGLFYLFDRVNKHQIDRPGQEEVLITEEEDPFYRRTV